MLKNQCRRLLPTKPRGAVLVYAVVVFPVVFLLMALAVDIGRGRVAKSELQTAVDAAVRAAAEDIARSRSTDAAIASAIAVAQVNNVDGKPVQLQSSDIGFGFWDTANRTYTPNGSPTNAVQITGKCKADRGTSIPSILACFVGQAGEDVVASSTACVVKELAPFNAAGNVTFNHVGQGNGGQWKTDSYVGADAAYGSGAVRGNGHLLSNGTVTYNFTTAANAQAGWDNRVSNVVMGTIYTASGQDCQQHWTNLGAGSQWIEYGGWDNPGASTATPPAQTSFPTPTMPAQDRTPAEASSYLSGSTNGLSDLTISGGSNVTLPAGVYNLNSLSVTGGATLTFSGPVQLNLANNMTVDSAAILAAGGDARNLKINLCNPSAGNNMAISNLSQDLCADINGPNANLTFTQGDGGKAMMGRVKALNIVVNCTGSGSIHGDESLLGRFFLAR